MSSIYRSSPFNFVTIWSFIVSIGLSSLFFLIWYFVTLNGKVNEAIRDSAVFFPMIIFLGGILFFWFLFISSFQKIKIDHQGIILTNIFTSNKILFKEVTEAHEGKLNPLLRKAGWLIFLTGKFGPALAANSDYGLTIKTKNSQLSILRYPFKSNWEDIIKEIKQKIKIKRLEKSAFEF